MRLSNARTLGDDIVFLTCKLVETPSGRRTAPAFRTNSRTLSRVGIRESAYRS
jgi:hypothetical protein